ncbi:Hypothetical predicted protein [Drosophila guanche]|uniref:Uncharacterized protein n=1 Tax=Drosophila guanche TaxID=7266 RepID=A0A3B0KIS3_DROGU|nr:Hypothetical predicted protein [Drosophila guanche]
MAHVQKFVEDQEERLRYGDYDVAVHRQHEATVPMRGDECGRRSSSPVLQVMASPYISPAPSSCSSASPVVSPVESEESESEDDVVIVDWQPAPKRGELQRDAQWTKYLEGPLELPHT